MKSFLPELVVYDDPAFLFVTVWKQKEGNNLDHFSFQKNSSVELSLEMRDSYYN